MLANAVFLLGMMFVFVSYSVQEYYQVSVVSKAQYNDRAVVVAFGEALEHYLHRISPNPPPSLDVLVSTVGFEYLNSYRVDGLKYTTTTFSDSRLTYSKALVYLQNIGSGLNDSQYLADNQCGEDDFYTDAIWCGNKKSNWYVTDNRKVINQIINYTANQLDRTLQNFSHAFRLNGHFPSETADGVAITDNSSVSLSEGVGFSGVAANCAGIFNFDGAPLNCWQLWDGAGGDIAYHRHSSNYISLVVWLPFADKDGVPLVFSRNLEIE